MNKQTITTILLALVTMTGQAQSQQQEEQNQDTTINWKLEGTVDNAEPTDTLFIIDMEEQRDIASLQVKDGKIVSTGGTILARGLHGEAIENKLAELFEPFDEKNSK